MDRRNINDIAAHRRRKKTEKVFVVVIVASVGAILLLLLALNFSNIIAPFEGCGQKITGGRKPMTEAGFPVRTPGSINSVQALEDGFVLLSPTYIYIYNDDGSQRYARRHNYATPVLSIDGNRILLYDLNGRKYSMYDGEEMLFERTDNDDRILYGEIGSSGKVAIVYRSNINTNVLSVYGEKGKWQFTKHFTGENVMQVDFAHGDNDIIVSSIGFDSGNMSVTVRRLDTTSADEEGVWRVNLSDTSGFTTIAENLLPSAVYVRGERVFVLCDSALFVLDTDDGKIKGLYAFKGALIDYAFGDDIAAVLVNDFTANKVSLLTLDRDAKLLRSVEIVGGATQTAIHGGETAVLGAGVMYFYDNDVEKLGERFVLWEDFTQFVYANDAILLLGYDRVERLALGDETNEGTR
ncbi:MAG: DUF5711 family protein [Oscillospiraceae bacterium]|nr:DUF5711 family protein [Oscillospiraceae bacterium]